MGGGGAGDAAVGRGGAAVDAQQKQSVSKTEKNIGKSQAGRRVPSFGAAKSAAAAAAPQHPPPPPPTADSRGAFQIKL